MLFDEEQYQHSQNDAQRWLLQHLAGFVRTSIAFQGDAHGRIWRAAEGADSAQLAFTSSRGEGYVQLALAENGWVQADLYLQGALLLRAWLEQPYEEIDFWPDGADGAGEPPGRISKRGAWLQIECARFPGAAPGEGGYWSVEIVED